jgi:hypothetical protein
MLDRLYHRDAKHPTTQQQQEIDRFMSTPINNTRVIGIGGRLRSGKDTVADYLVEHHGFEKVWMSKPLDDALQIINPILHIGRQPWTANNWERYSVVREHLSYTEAKEFPEVRRFLQVLGTDFGRKMIHEDVWVDMAADNIQEVLDSGKSVVLTGVRFPNELDMIHRFKGSTWWTERLDTESNNSGAHESEDSLKWEDFDFPIINDGTIAQLHAKASEGLEFGRVEWMDAHDEMTEYIARTATGQQWGDALVQATADVIKSTGFVIDHRDSDLIIKAAPADKILPDISDEEFEAQEERAEAERTAAELALIKAEEEKGINYIPNDSGRTVRIDKMHKVAQATPLTVERERSDAALVYQAYQNLANTVAEKIVEKIKAGTEREKAMELAKYTGYSNNPSFQRTVKARVEGLLEAAEKGDYAKPETRIEQRVAALNLVNPTPHEAAERIQAHADKIAATAEAAPVTEKTWDDLMADMKAHNA